MINYLTIIIYSHFLIHAILNQYFFGYPGGEIGALVSTVRHVHNQFLNLFHKTHAVSILIHRLWTARALSVANPINTVFFIHSSPVSKLTFRIFIHQLWIFFGVYFPQGVNSGFLLSTCGKLV